MLSLFGLRAGNAMRPKRQLEICQQMLQVFKKCLLSSNCIHN